MKRILFLLVTVLTLASFASCSAYKILTVTISGQQFSGPIPNCIINGSQGYMNYLVDHVNNRQPFNNEEVKSLKMTMMKGFASIDKSSDMAAIGKDMERGKLAPNSVIVMMSLVEQLAKFEYYPSGTPRERDLYTANIIAKYSLIFNFAEQVYGKKINRNVTNSVTDADTGEKYGDIKAVLTKMVNATEAFVASMDSANDAQAVVAAINTYTESLKGQHAKFQEMMDTYPELKDSKEIPKELKEMVEKLNGITEKLTVAMGKVETYATDPDVIEAKTRMSELQTQ